MKRLFRNSKLVIVSAALALSSLVFATGATPAAHASPSALIDAYGHGGGVQVYGS